MSTDRRRLARAYTALRWRNGSPARSSRTTASTSASPSSCRPSVTAATMPRLRSMQRGHRLVDRLGRQQVPGGHGVALADAVAAVLGLVVHRRASTRARGSATFDARVSVMPCAGDARRARRSAAGPSGPWKARTAASRAGERVARRAGAARRGSARGPPPGPRRGGRRRRAARPRRGSRGSTPARRASLPRAARRWSVPSCARRSARSVAAIFASSSREVERLLAQPGDRRRRSASRYSRSLSSATGHDDLALGRQLGEDLGLQAPHEAAPAQVPVQALLGQPRPWNCAGEARAGAEVLQAADDAQLGDELLGVVEHRRAGQREAQPVRRRRRSASRRTACVRLACGFLT